MKLSRYKLRNEIIVRIRTKSLVATDKSILLMLYNTVLLSSTSVVLLVKTTTVALEIEEIATFLYPAFFCPIVDCVLITSFLSPG